MSNIRHYQPAGAIVFCRTREAFGGLSNMAAGFPVCSPQGERYPSSEALYQAARFPFRPDIRQEIARAPNAFLAKQAARRHIALSRPDWMKVRVRVMRECLRAKFECNRLSFGRLLRATGEKPIVEYSSRDNFWGARREGDVLVGQNVLGRLLMALRDEEEERRRQHEHLVFTEGGLSLRQIVAERS